MDVNVVGLFDTHSQAELAVRELLAAGFDSRAISLVGSNAAGTVVRQTVDESGDMASEGAVTGAASGLLVGGLLGLLAGATVLAAPPVGFVIAGPIAGLITGAGLGMVSGGLLGALIGLEIPEEHAHVYAESVRRGSTLVAITVNAMDRLRVEQIFASCDAIDIEDRALQYRQNGFVAFEPNSPVFTPAEVAAERARSLREAFPATPQIHSDPILNSELENAFLMDYARSGAIGSFEHYRPAYQFGHDLALRPEFRNQIWLELSPQAQRLWEQRNPGTWDHFYLAILAGWTISNSIPATPRATVI